MGNKLILYISSYIPLYLLLIGKNILERITDGGRFINIADKMKHIKLFDEINDYMIVIMLILSILSFMYVKRKIQSIEGKTQYQVEKITDETSNYYFNYISLYFLSCLGLSLNNIVDCFIFLFLMLLIGYIYISNNTVYLNPVINLMGYKIYLCTLKSMQTNDEEFDTILISSKKERIHLGDNIMGTKKQDFVCVSGKYYL
jgi:hypothetical protein